MEQFYLLHPYNYNPNKSQKWDRANVFKFPNKENNATFKKILTQQLIGQNNKNQKTTDNKNLLGAKQ